jgi:hypothetical protein
MNSETIEYAIIIDTDKYSGNFERQLCAYITGCIGECGVSEEIATAAVFQLKEKAKWFDENVLAQNDDHGVSRPVRIEPTPGYFNDGLGNHYKDGTDPKIVKQKYQKAAKEYDSKNKIPGRYPAYQSIIIFLAKAPPVAIRKVIIQRAHEFANNLKDCGENFVSKFEILNIRFIKRKTIVIDEEI